jgi:hypothetical protein
MEDILIGIPAGFGRVSHLKKEGAIRWMEFLLNDQIWVGERLTGLPIECSTGKTIPEIHKIHKEWAVRYVYRLINERLRKDWFMYGAHA